MAFDQIIRSYFIFTNRFGIDCKLWICFDGLELLLLLSEFGAERLIDSEVVFNSYILFFFEQDQSFCLIDLVLEQLLADVNIGITQARSLNDVDSILHGFDFIVE